jgi:FtsZ-interacting cell division protein ZipA
MDNKAGYYETWRALANMQKPGTYLYDNLRNLADILQATEKDVC